jgi:hypothetical protein
VRSIDHAIADDGGANAVGREPAEFRFGKRWGGRQAQYRRQHGNEEASCPILLERRGHIEVPTRN